LIVLCILTHNNELYLIFPLECLNLQQNRKEKILFCLKRYQHILKNNLVLVDITLGLWSQTKSLEFMEEIVNMFYSFIINFFKYFIHFIFISQLNTCIMSSDQSSSQARFE